MSYTKKQVILDFDEYTELVNAEKNAELKISDNKSHIENLSQRSN